jgi:hypothetical protein
VAIIPAPGRIAQTPAGLVMSRPGVPDTYVSYGVPAIPTAGLIQASRVITMLGI